MPDGAASPEGLPQAGGSPPKEARPMAAERVTARSLVPSAGVHASVTVPPEQAVPWEASVLFITARKSHAVISALHRGPGSYNGPLRLKGRGHRPHISLPVEQ